MTKSFAVVCEARADAEIACALADRVICDAVEWIEHDSLPYHRHYRGYLAVEPFMQWTEVDNHALPKGLRIRGRFDDQPVNREAQSTRRVLHLLQSIKGENRPDAILLIRDDDRFDRRSSLQRARVDLQRKLADLVPVVIGIPIPMRESWVLAGFEPTNDSERQRHTELCRELGFDPCREGHRLNTDKQSPRYAKRVLPFLTEHNRNRELTCWEQTPLPLLKERGAQIGLAEYFNEVRTLLVPLFKPAVHP